MHALTLKWSTSKGRDTYGYNICTLTDENGHKYRTCGGGYDMIGTVFGEWLAARHQEALQAIKDRAGSYFSKADGYKTHRIPDGGSLPFGRPDPAYLYGMTRNDDKGTVSLDGACGIETMMNIAREAGFKVEATHNTKGHKTGFIVVRA